MERKGEFQLQVPEAETYSSPEVGKHIPTREDKKNQSIISPENKGEKGANVAGEGGRDQMCTGLL